MIKLWLIDNQTFQHRLGNSLMSAGYGFHHFSEKTRKTLRGAIIQDELETHCSGAIKYISVDNPAKDNLTEWARSAKQAMYDFLLRKKKQPNLNTIHSMLGFDWNMEQRLKQYKQSPAIQQEQPKPAERPIEHKRVEQPIAKPKPMEITLPTEFNPIANGSTTFKSALKGWIKWNVPEEWRNKMAILMSHIDSAEWNNYGATASTCEKVYEQMKQDYTAQVRYEQEKQSGNRQNNRQYDDAIARIETRCKATEEEIREMYNLAIRSNGVKDPIGWTISRLNKPLFRIAQ